MQHNTTKATASQINNLIAIAQAAPSEYAHDKAMYTLWDIFGDYVMALVAKNSFLTSSDFSLNGCSPKERKANLAGDAYMVFCKAVQDFDPSMNVPFEAFFANKIRWHVADEKRKNAKRDKVEKVESKLKKNDDDDYSCLENEDTNPFTEERNVLESDYEQCEIIDIIRHRLANSPKMLKAFNTMYDVSRNCDKYTDVEVAQALHCTRANTGKIKKNICKFLIDCGLEDECRLLMAA
ncbi:MAG: hypothetical protein SPL52_00200 [Fibrobacter sp.]|nr:hypothetical protein [Fibrobacter sp.]